MGPIDHLIWMDQLNGIFLALVIVTRLVAISIPFPLSKITGKLASINIIYLLNIFELSVCQAVYLFICPYKSPYVHLPICPSKDKNFTIPFAAFY